MDSDTLRVDAPISTVSEHSVRALIPYSAFATNSILETDSAGPAALLIPTIRVMMAEGCFAQTKRPMTVDDLITAVRVGDPQLSSDNKRVVYTRTITALDSGKRNTDIWVVPADSSSAPRPFIGGEKSESSARFTPDGQPDLFISNRDVPPRDS